MSAFLKHNPPDEATLPWLAGAAALGEQPAPDWVRALRHTGAEAFARSGLPTPAWEGWQYTALRPLTQGAFHYSARPAPFDVGRLPLHLLAEAGRVVLVNGQYQPQLSRLPEGVRALSLMDACAQVDGIEEHLVTVGDLAAAPFKALNAAHMHDGVVLLVEKNTDVTTPVEILYYNTGDGAVPAPESKSRTRQAASGAAIHPRALYKLGENSSLTLIERHTGDGVYFTNAYIGIALGPSARLRHYRFEEESAAACHLSHTAVQQDRNSVFEGFSLASGGKLVREEYRNLLIDSGISSIIAGVYLIKDQQLHDFTILTDHFEPNGTSVQHIKGVVDAQARAVFQGKIHVHRSAQKTDGSQLNHALLLSATAEADVKPELEIYADDVKCSHGATSGRLDNNALFYLQSRGIPADEARALLVESFLTETLARVSFAPVKELYQERIRSWLAR